MVELQFYQLIFFRTPDAIQFPHDGMKMKSYLWKIPYFIIIVVVLGFDDMDSIFASPEDFQDMKLRDKIRGLHLLEYFVGRCSQIGVF